MALRVATQGKQGSPRGRSRSQARASEKVNPEALLQHGGYRELIPLHASRDCGDKQHTSKLGVEVTSRDSKDKQCFQPEHVDSAGGTPRQGRTVFI